MGVRSLALFGSMAREEARPDSDIDVLVDVPPMTLFSIIRIGHYLTDVLGRKVDLVSRDIKHAAQLLDVPYQVYIKQLVIKQAMMDIESAERTDSHRQVAGAGIPRRAASGGLPI